MIHASAQCGRAKNEGSGLQKCIIISQERERERKSKPHSGISLLSCSAPIACSEYKAGDGMSQDTLLTEQNNVYIRSLCPPGPFH